MKPAENHIAEKTGVLSMSMPPFTVHVFDQPEAFEFLYHEWEALARKSGQSVFMSPDWACRWWKHFGRHADRSLYIMYVRIQDKPVAILPFYRGVTRVQQVVLEQRLQLIGSGGNTNEALGYADDYGISDFLDVLVDPDYNDLIAGVFMDLLKTSALSEHRIILSNLRSDSYLYTHIKPLLTQHHCGERVIQTDDCPFIDLSQTVDFKTYLAACKSNARRRFRQTLRAGEDFTIETITTKPQLRAAIRMLAELHQARWNDAGYPGLFADKRFRAFFTDIAISAMNHNRLWCKQVTDSKGVCAIRILLLYNNRLYDYMSGFDTESPSAAHRPGIALMLQAITDSLEHRIEKVELLRGRESYKFDFTQHEITNWKIDIPVQKSPARRTNHIRGVALESCATVHKYTLRELGLLRVQYKQKGAFRMLFGYLQFRLPLLARRLRVRT